MSSTSPPAFLWPLFQKLSHICPASRRRQVTNLGSGKSPPALRTFLKFMLASTKLRRIPTGEGTGRLGDERIDNCNRRRPGDRRRDPLGTHEGPQSRLYRRIS